MPSARPGQVLLNLAGLVIVVAGLKAGEPVLVPLTFALFLTILSLPLLHSLHRRAPWPLAVLVTVLANLALLLGLVALLSGSATAFVAAAPRYWTRWQLMLERLGNWLVALGLPAEDWLSLEQVGPSAVFDLVGTTLLGVASLLTDLLLVILFLVFILLETRRLPAKLYAAVGTSQERLRRFDRAGREVQRYLLIKTLVSAVTGVLIGVGVTMIGLDLPLLWGFLAFLLNYIPNLGSIIAAVPPTLLALVQLGVGPTLLVIGLYVAVNFLLGNLIEPNLMGRRLGLSPLVVFVALIFGGWLWGAIGMFLAVPSMVIVRIVLEQSDEYRWVATLLAARPPAPPAPPAEQAPVEAG